MRGPVRARFCSGKLACTFSLRTNASSSVPSLHVLASFSSQFFLAPRSARSKPDRQSGVLNDRRHRPSCLRREANDGRQWELARGLKQNLANVAKSQYLDAWYKSALVFLAKELERTRLRSRLGTVAPERRLRKQHGCLGMCLFVSGREYYCQVNHECEHQDVLLPKQDSS